MQSAEQRSGAVAGGFWNPFVAKGARALVVVLLAAAVGVACGSSSSPNDGGGTGGTTGTGGAVGATGTGGAGGKAAGTGGAGGMATSTGGAGGKATGSGGQGGVPAINGISQACQQCAATSCTTQILTCAWASACQACVTNDYNSCITSGNAQYKAVCTCAKAACAACATYCP